MDHNGTMTKYEYLTNGLKHQLINFKFTQISEMILNIEFHRKHCYISRMFQNLLKHQTMTSNRLSQETGSRNIFIEYASQQKQLPFLIRIWNAWQHSQHQI